MKFVNYAQLSILIKDIILIVDNLIERLGNGYDDFEFHDEWEKLRKLLKEMDYKENNDESFHPYGRTSEGRS